MIKAQFKRLTSHSAIYGISGILNAAISFLLTPLYANYLDPRDYGFLTILTITASFASMLFQLGTGTAVFRSIIQREIDKRVVLSTAYYFTLVVTIIGVSSLLLLSPHLARLLLPELETGANYLNLVLTTAALDSLAAISFAKLRVEERSLIYTIISALNFAFGLTLNILFVAALKYGLNGILWSNLLRAIVFSMVGFFILLPDLRLKFSLSELSELVGFGLPLVPISFAALILSGSDRYFLQYYFSPTEVGVYSIGYKVGSLLQLPIGAFQIAWPTIMFAVSKSQQAQEFYSRLLTYYFLIAGFAVMSLSLFSKEIIMLIAQPSFLEAWTVVPIVALSQICIGCVYITAIGVNLKKKPSHLMFAWLFGVTIHLLLNFTLIPRFGMIGAALSTLFSYLVVVAGALFTSLRLYYIPYQTSRLIKLICIYLILYFISFVIPENISLVHRILLKIFVISITPILLWISGFFTPEEKSWLQGWTPAAKIIKRLRHI